MRNRLLSILLILMIVCFGCKSHKAVSETASRDLWQETNIEARHLDSVSLSKSIGYRLNIDFFPPQDSALPVYVSAIQAENGLPMIHGAVRRVTVETERNATVARAVVDSVSAKETRTESDFKSVDESVEKSKDTLPLLVGIIALIVAVCCLITYKIRK